MSRHLVLLTGASGHLGFRTVVNALEAGYHVRAAVRSQSKADAILAAPSIKALAPAGKLHFIIVPDITVVGAYDQAVKDVEYVIHIASPLVPQTNDYEHDVLEPALKGTMGILESALKVSTVKRIVITSSIIAVVPWTNLAKGKLETVITANDRTPDPHGPFSSGFEAYAAAKTIALNATDRFVETRNPAFDVINIMPVYLIGKSELINGPAEITNGTNRIAFSPILGGKSETAQAGIQVHVDDVAKVHVLSLRPEIKGSQNFGAMSGGVAGNEWEDALDIVKKHFPAAVKDGRLLANGTQPTKKVLFDCRRTEEVLGIRLRSFEDQVVEVTEHYLELLEKEKNEANC